MYNFYSSFLKRYYPSWSKIRKDESSNGGMLLEALSTLFGMARENLLYTSVARRVIEGLPVLDYTNITIYNLNEDDNFREQYSQSTDINVSVSFVGDEINLERISDRNYFTVLAPTRIQLNNTLLGNTIVDLESENFLDEEVNLSSNGNYVYITLENSSYETKNNYPTYNRVTNNELLEESYYIIVRGLDIGFEPIEEIIFVKDQFTYKTKNQFTKLMSLEEDEAYSVTQGPSIELVGFNSVFKISNYNIHKVLEKTSYSIATSDDKDIEDVEGYTLDNDLIFSIYTDENENNFIKFYYIPYLHAKFYRHVLDYELKEKIISEQFLNVEGQIRDYCYDKLRNKIYTLNQDFSISIFDIQKEGFSLGFINRTKMVSLSLESVGQRVKKDETKTLNTVLLNGRDLVGDYIIFRETPNTRGAAQDFALNIEFLQENKTWSQEGYVFKSSFSLGKEKFEPLYFDVDFNTEGQWDFYIIEPDESLKIAVLNSPDYETRVAEIKRLIDANVKEPISKIKINKYSILVEQAFSLREYREWSVNLGLDPDSSYKICKEGVSNQLKIINLTNNNIYLLDEKMDYFYLDFENKLIATTEEYTSATITYGDVVIQAEE